MKVKEFKSFDDYENYVESDSYNELVPTIIIDKNYCAIDFTTYCKSWKTAIRRAMKIFIKYEDVVNWMDGMKESCENNCFTDRSVYDGKYTGDYAFGVEEVSDGVFYIYLKYRTTETETEEATETSETEETEETVKEVMEVKQELNARFGKEQYFDTDSLQPNNTIIAKIEDINYCPNQNTCCVVSPFVHCNYNYKSDSCIKAHKNFIHDCEQVHKQMKARSNPEWHHVSLATLANIDFDMLDEKRKLVFGINQILKDGIRNLYKCENHISFEVLERYVIRKCDELIRHNRLKAFWFSYVARQLDEVRRNTIYLYTPYITAHRNRW